ncbi:MAG: hypothetical protein K2L11_04165 [Muribaculaceae bacterium]|nr:hypothetical protein [Muribaculaceae bacterium]
MLIPLIKKNPELNDFTCRDGEIDFMENGLAQTVYAMAYSNNPSLIRNNSSLEKTLRIPLLDGEKEKAALLLNGEISRVDPATAERITGELVRKAAECLLDYSTDLRRQGLFILPFRFFTMTMLPDGTLSYPGPQALALPAGFPPHPEITAASVTDDALTVAIRFPVVPHRLCAEHQDSLPEGCSTRIFISYPL